MKLNDIAEFVTDKISSSSISLENYVTTDSLLQNKRGRETAQNLPPMLCALTHYKRGDVLVANIRPYLKKVWFADSEGGCSSDVLVFRAKNGHYPSFLYTVLLQDAFFDYAMSGAKGSKMPRGDKDQIMRYELPTFTSLEEENIGNIMVDIMSKINVNRQINDNLEAMAKQLYDYWFVQFDFPNEEDKPYKSSGGAMVWNEKLKREIPQGWTAAKIKDVAQTYSGGTPTSTNSEYYDGGDIPWINSGELNNPIITSTTNYITEEGLNNSSAKLYPQNTVLVALYGATAGKVSLLSFEACSNQAVCGVIPQNKIMTTYIRYYLSSLYEHFITLSSGSARDNISQDTIKNTILPIPQEKILKEFSDAVAPIISKIIANQKEMETLTKQRDELLPLLMNGRATLNYHLFVMQSRLSSYRRLHPFYVLLYTFCVSVKKCFHTLC